MTTLVAHHGSHSDSARPAPRRLLRRLTSFGTRVLDTIDTARALGAARTPEARRAVLARYTSRLSA
jgi:hypothetical protein